MPKLLKVTAGYLPARFVHPRGTSCESCRDFIRFSSECMITEPAAVSATRGTCQQYLMGKPHGYGVPLRIIPRELVGYIEGPEVPTFCGRCKHYEQPSRAFSLCSKVGDSEEDRVEYGGCCNGYEPSDKVAASVSAGKPEPGGESLRTAPERSRVAISVR